jgi:ATP-dependent helicase/nuclease subunit A
VALTSRQLEAVAVREDDRDACVVAGPGSGKTTVLVEYFERLVAAGKDPLRILAITFTDKAANNMREKLAQRFQESPEIRGRLERAWVSTVHGFCARLLKENAIFAGIDPDFYVMDERESARLQRLAVDEVLDAMFAEQPERMRALMRGLSGVDTGGALLDAYDAIRAAGTRIGELAAFPQPDGVSAAEVLAAFERLRHEQPRGWSLQQMLHLDEVRQAGQRIAEAAPQGAAALLRAVVSFDCNLKQFKRGNPVYELVRSISKELLPALEYSLVTEYYAPGRAAIFDLLARFDRLYRERKQQAGGLDYDDLEEYAVRLLEENPDVRRRLQAQFDRVLMDEFQDTNGRQAKLLELLRPPGRFYAVGDINQSIYGFRHAEPEVFREYRGRVARGGGRLVELVENFRSRPDILHAVEAVVDGAAGIEPRPLVPGLSFPDKTGPSVEVLAALAENIDAALALEAQWVAARILELEGRLPLRQKTAEFRDFAVLVRNSEVLGEFTRAFDEGGIPYLVSRGKGFYETREVVDLMHLLRVLVNPRDEIAVAAVLRSPFVGASDEALFRLKREGNLGASLERLTPERLAGFAPDDAERLDRFRGQLERWRALRDDLGIDRLLLRALDECGYQCPSGPRGAANIEKFLAQARAAGARQSLAEFVEEIELLRASQPREPDAPPEDSANAVKIMTVHSAKGLEFPVVFVAALHKGIESGPGGISFLPRVGLGARWKHPFKPGDDKDDSFQHAIREALKTRENEEGNRLFYVAMTRAEEHLVLSLSTNGKKPQNWAALLKGSLGLELETPCDRTVTVTAPGGERVPLWVRCVNVAPARPAPVRERAETAASVRELARPVLAGQHDSQANVTSITLFADCPRRYYLSRYLGFEGAPGAPEDADGGSGLSAADLGNQVHALLAGAAVESPDPEAVRLVETFRKSALGRRSAGAAIVEREFDFLMEVEDVVLRGQIDLWFQVSGKTVLVDYKTDRVSAAEAPARAERYALQLRLYALALERLHGRAPDEAWLYFLRPDVAVPIDLRPSLFNAPEPLVRAFREAQETSRFPLKEGEHCRACPHFARLCPAGSPSGMRDVVHAPAVHRDGLRGDEAGVG